MLCGGGLTLFEFPIPNLIYRAALQRWIVHIRLLKTEVKLIWALDEYIWVTTNHSKKNNLQNSLKI